MWMSMDNPIKVENVRKTRDNISDQMKLLNHQEHISITETLPAPYIAGAMDGDGCYCMSVGKAAFQFEFFLVQKHKPICEAIKNLYGGHLSFRNEPWPLWRWRITTKSETIQFLIDMAPFAIEKKAQLNLLTDLLNNNINPHETKKKLSALKGRQLWIQKKNALQQLLSNK